NETSREQREKRDEQPEENQQDDKARRRDQRRMDLRVNRAVVVVVFGSGIDGQPRGLGRRRQRRVLALVRGVVQTFQRAAADPEKRQGQDNGGGLSHRGVGCRLTGR